MKQGFCFCGCFAVRDCYKEIADIMLRNEPHRMSLLCSSGIGKSNFAIYLIWRRFQDSELKEFPVFLHRKDRILQFKKGKEPKEVDVKTLRSAPAQALYIMDADIDVEHGVDCQSLWITSARRRAFQERREWWWAVLHATMDEGGDAERHGHGVA